MRCFLKNKKKSTPKNRITKTLLSIIDTGDSFAVMDSDTQLYESLRQVCIDRGYEIRFCDLNVPHVSNSSNFLLYSDPDTLAECILQNTSLKRKEDNSDNFMNTSEKALLTIVMLYVLQHRTEHSANLPDMIDFLFQHDMRELEEIFLDEEGRVGELYDSLLKPMPEIVTFETMSRLRERLQPFRCEPLKTITSKDEVDFSLPVRKKCAYFVAIPEEYKEKTLYSSMYIASLIDACMCAIDGDRNQKDFHSIPFHMICYTSDIGMIPSFDSKLIILRSYKISITKIDEQRNDRNNHIESILFNMSFRQKK